jgi:hypothetical protein
VHLPLCAVFLVNGDWVVPTVVSVADGCLAIGVLPSPLSSLLLPIWCWLAEVVLMDRDLDSAVSCDVCTVVLLFVPDWDGCGVNCALLTDDGAAREISAEAACNFCMASAPQRLSKCHVQQQGATTFSECDILAWLLLPLIDWYH